MKRANWEKSKQQIRKAIQEGVADIKEWAAEASYLTSATTEVVKLEMEVHRLRTQIEKTLRRLGHEVVRTASAEGTLRQAPSLKKLIASVRSLEKRLQQTDRQIKGTPLTWQAAKKAVGKKPASRSGNKTRH